MTPAVRNHLPTALAALLLGGIYALIAQRFAVGPRGILPIIVLLLVVLRLTSIRFGRFTVSRQIGIVLLAVITIAEAISTSLLVAGLADPGQRTNAIPHEDALSLLRDSALIWLINVLTFSFWYWEIDGGGPAQRHHHGYTSDDLLFPQIAEDHGSDWQPHYVDYLFLAFSTSTAFSATDTLILSRRTKLLVMAQSLISLIVLAVIAARAVNTL